MEAKLFNPSMAYKHQTPSPKKRPRIESKSLFKTPTYKLARIILEHVSRVDIFSPALSPSQSYEKLLQAGKDGDAK